MNDELAAGSPALTRLWAPRDCMLVTALFSDQETARRYHRFVVVNGQPIFRPNGPTPQQGCWLVFVSWCSEFHALAVHAAETKLTMLLAEAQAMGGSAALLRWNAKSGPPLRAFVDKPTQHTQPTYTQQTRRILYKVRSGAK